MVLKPKIDATLFHILKSVVFIFDCKTFLKLCRTERIFFKLDLLMIVSASEAGMIVALVVVIVGTFVAGIVLMVVARQAGMLHELRHEQRQQQYNLFPLYSVSQESETVVQDTNTADRTARTTRASMWEATVNILHQLASGAPRSKTELLEHRLPAASQNQEEAAQHRSPPPPTQQQQQQQKQGFNSAPATSLYRASSRYGAYGAAGGGGGGGGGAMARQSMEHYQLVRRLSSGAPARDSHSPSPAYYYAHVPAPAPLSPAFGGSGKAPGSPTYMNNVDILRNKCSTTGKKRSTGERGITQPPMIKESRDDGFQSYGENTGCTASETPTDASSETMEPEVCPGYMNMGVVGEAQASSTASHYLSLSEVYRGAHPHSANSSFCMVSPLRRQTAASPAAGGAGISSAPSARFSPKTGRIDENGYTCPALALPVEELLESGLLSPKYSSSVPVGLSGDRDSDTKLLKKLLIARSLAV
jgi:hypothetical protein